MFVLDGSKAEGSPGDMNDPEFEQFTLFHVYFKRHIGNVAALHLPHHVHCNLKLARASIAELHHFAGVSLPLFPYLSHPHFPWARSGEGIGAAASVKMVGHCVCMLQDPT